MTVKSDTCLKCKKKIPFVTTLCTNCGWVTMNDGDYHSGPYGYSPNTAYPETQYGSGFDEEAEWNQETPGKARP